MVLAPVIPYQSRVKHPTNSSKDIVASVQKHSPNARLEEAVGLAHAISLEIAHREIITLKTPRPATLFGEGKITELQSIIDNEDIELVIVDHILTPVQQRNLETKWDLKVLDRTGLILEIFGERARTKRGAFAGRICASGISKKPFGTFLDAFGAAKGWIWLSGRSWGNAN